MIRLTKPKTLKWMAATLALSLVIGCSSSNSQSANPPSPTDSTSQTAP